jgi:hypothetical protein
VRPLARGIVTGLAAGAVLAATAAAAWSAYQAHRSRRPRMKLVNGAWHHEMCLVARYPAASGDMFPWCTCEWRRSPRNVAGGR